MKEFIDGIKEKARQNPRTIVFPEGTEERVIRAARWQIEIFFKTMKQRLKIKHSN